MEYDGFLRDLKTQDAVIRNLVAWYATRRTEVAPE